MLYHKNGLLHSGLVRMSVHLPHANILESFPITADAGTATWNALSDSTSNEMSIHDYSVVRM